MKDPGAIAEKVSSASLAPQLHPDSAALRGLPGDVVRTIEPYTEADCAALLVGTLTTFGAMVGQMAEIDVGFAKHPPALSVALVGRTSRARKGTATTETDGLMRHVEDGWHEQHQVSGFGSGEAFIEHASANPGSAIYVVETELARLLAVASREGSSISSVLRAAWDFRRMEHRIRRQRYDAPAAPVSLVAHITMDELRDARHGLRLLEIMNGFGNRFLWTYVDRRSRIADPQRIPSAELAPLTSCLRRALESARSAGVVGRTPKAGSLWADLYERMAADDGAGVVDALTARAEAQVLRLSLIYALMDGAREIDVPHLESAWEVWRYCRWSAQHIFVGSGTGDPDMDRIAGVLASGEELSGRDLDRMFLGHRSIPELRQKAIDLGIAKESTRETKGRPAMLLTVADKADKADKGWGWWREPVYRIERSPSSETSSTSAAFSALQAHPPTPTVEDLLALAAEMDHPFVQVPHDEPELRIGGEFGWKDFAEGASPELRLAAFEALEDLEAAWSPSDVASDGATLAHLREDVDLDQ
jgi:hypothetical protein